MTLKLRSKEAPSLLLRNPPPALARNQRGLVKKGSFKALPYKRNPNCFANEPVMKNKIEL